MRQTIVIIGALPGDPLRTELLDKLNAAAPSVDWEWIRAESGKNSRPEEKHLSPLFASYGRKQLINTIIIKLPMLHGKTHDQLRKISCCRLVLAPKTHQTIDQLIQWLVCPDSNLIPPQEWLVSVREAAFLAIISKLIRGRRWANDCSGHSFLKKNDLINQSPVQRSGYEAVRISAVEQLNLLITEGILLKKGAEQGKTPLEFAINSIHLKQLKQLMTNRSFISLADQAFQKILNFIRHDQTPKNINALDGIVTAQTIEQCQKQNNSENV